MFGFDAIFLMAVCLVLVLSRVLGLGFGLDRIAGGGVFRPVPGVSVFVFDGEFDPGSG